MEADPWKVLKDHKYPLIIIGVGLAVYFNMLFNGFVWDDKTYIINNPQIHTLNVLSLIKENLFNMDGQYRPLPAIYLAYAYAIFRNTPFFYHIMQLLLHIGNAILVFYFFKKFFSKKFSLITSLIFLIHPIQVESVSFIGAVASEFFFLFGMIAMIIGERENIDWKSSIGIFFFLLLSLLTKESGFQFLFLILAYRIIFKKRYINHFLIVEVCTILVYFFIRFIIGGVYFGVRAAAPIAQLDTFTRLANIPALFFFYIKTFVFPWTLVIDQQWVITKFSLSSLYLPLLLDFFILLAIGFLGVYIYQKKKLLFKAYVFFCTWFFVGIGLYMQIFPLDMTVAERWFYLPIVGLLGILGIASQQRIFIRYKQSIYIGSIVIVILFSIRTISRNTNWVDAITLYTHDSVYYKNFDLENNLGAEYESIGEYSQAINHFKTSLSYQRTESALCNLGNVYLKMKQPNKALYYCSQALQMNSFSSKHNVGAYEQITQSLILLHEYKKADAIAIQGIHEYPTAGDLWAMRAISAYNLHNIDMALQAAKNAMKFSTELHAEYIYNQILNGTHLEL